MGSVWPRVSFFSSQCLMVTDCDEKNETQSLTEAKMFNLPSDPYPEITSSCYPLNFCESFIKSPRVNGLSLMRNVIQFSDPIQVLASTLNIHCPGY